MSMPITTDVLISGAGAAGLTLAIELARWGVPFRLVEQLEAPFHGSRGKGIQPRTLEVFEDLGLVDKLAASGGEYPPQRDHRPDGSFVDVWPMQRSAPTAAEPYRQPLLVPQFLTESVLRERLAELGHRVIFGCELLDFREDADGITARVATPRGEETIRTRFLVGTDGGRSPMRRALGIDFPGRTLGLRAVVADVRLEGLGRDAWHRWNEGDMARQVSLCPLAGTPLFQMQAPVPAEGEIEVTVQGLGAMLEARTGRRDIPILEVSWGSVYSMNARLADRYRVGRAFLAGDAAHIHPPTGGQGLNTSVQDAYNLGWKLASVLRGAPDALLDSYEAERRPIAAEMLGLTARLLDAARQGSMERGREVHQLDIAYPDSPIAFQAGDRSGRIAAGGRAPDARLRGAAGQRTRLFMCTRGAHWTAIGYHPAREGKQLEPIPGLAVHRIGPDGDLRDDEGSFANAYGVPSGDWVVIRPDGYIGAIVEDARLAGLDGYLRSVGLPVPSRSSLCRVGVRGAALAGR